MRLLFCCEFYYPSIGGVQEVIRQVAERMVRAGHDVTVATSHIAERSFDVLNGVHIRSFKVRGNLARGMKGEVRRYRDFVVGFGADAILVKAAQQWTFDALWPVLDQIKARKIFVPCGFSGLYEPGFADYFRRMPEILQKFDHLIFYSENYRDIDFARAHNLNNYSIISNGASETEFEIPADPKARSRLGISDEEFVFITIGKPMLAKGHREVAEAFARLDIGSRRAVLILNGDWPRPEPSLAWGRPGRAIAAVLRRVWQAVQRLFARAYRVSQAVWDEGWAAVWKRWRSGGLPNRWHELHQWIASANAQPGKRVLQTNLSRSELIQTLRCSDLFVFASHVEYSPLVLFEAAAAGTPFISVPVGNAEEIARWTGAGWICPAPQDQRGFTHVDPSVLAHEMQVRMSDPDALARFAQTGKAQWRARFTWDVIAPRYEAILAGRENPGTQGLSCQADGLALVPRTRGE